MAERNKEGVSPPALGGSSLLVAFAVLALTVFALLGLSTVQADVRLADASAQAVADYYAADCRAQELLARVLNGEEPEGVEVLDLFGTYAVRYSVPISDTQELQVEVELEWPGTGRRYQVTRWQAAPVGEWEPDDSLNVWSGEEDALGVWSGEEE